MFGIIPAKVLGELTTCLHSNGLGKELWQYFDVIAGNSTGSIIAAGLVTKVKSTPPLALTADELVRIYQEDATKIFNIKYGTTTKKVLSILLTRSLYDNEDRLKVISSHLGNKTSKEALTNFVIPFYDLVAGPVFFSRDHGAHERTFEGSNTEFSEKKYAYMTDLVMYSSAAPIYFNPYKGREVSSSNDLRGRRLPGYIAYDGALYQNNPTLLAIMEARRDHPNASLHVLSLGDGISYRSALLGAIDWHAPKNNLHSLALVPAFMESASRAVDEYLRSDPRIDYTRIDGPIPSGTSLSMDDGSEDHMAKLQNIADNVVRSASAEIAGVCKVLHATKD